MRTRGLKFVINSEGILKTKPVNIEDYKKKKFRKIYGHKIKESLLNTLNLLINYYKDFNNPELTKDNEDKNQDKEDEDKVKDISNLISKIRSKYENSYEDYVTNISNKICNKCYDEYSGDERILKRKLFDITSNIKRVNNYELREKILLNQISIPDLIKLEIVELAPEEVKNQRRAQVENHYIRNVILNATSSKDSSPQGAAHSLSNSPDKERGTAHSQANSERNKLDTIENLKEFFLNNPTSNSSNSRTTSTNDSFNNYKHHKRDVDDVDDEEVGDINTTRIRNELIINDDESESQESDARSKSVKLANPPNVTQFKYETISLRLANRINSLPNSFRRPFLDNFRQATRRLEILMKRSSILTGKLNNC